MSLDVVAEEFTPEERARLAPFFTDLDGPVFALVNLPEVVKGALFARYSRSAKSLRRLFLDEFAEGQGEPETASGFSVERAEKLYERVFLEYGDDSVAQLGGVHLACEQSSQLLAKVLERGRLAAYLEQSTRYVPYDDRPGGRWRYHVPEEVQADAAMARRYRATLDGAFETYARWLEPLQAYFREVSPKDPADSEFVYRMTIRARACDVLRALLPAATRSNVGIFATAQSYEQLLLRMRGHPLAEARAFADLMLTELRKVIPAFLTRVDVPDRGGAWTSYLQQTGQAVQSAAETTLGEVGSEPRPEVVLTRFDPDGETEVVAAALYEASGLADDQLLEAARAMGSQERMAVLHAAIGDRTNRRHKPGRAFERTSYRFDVLCDYGAFRDLQRHRTLTVQWQRLGPDHGFELPPEIQEVGAAQEWLDVMESSRLLHDALVEPFGRDVAQYAVAMAYRIRFVMDMNAREAIHMIELRTTPQGHPVYRRVCQEMFRLIRDQAGHRVIAEAMRFVDLTGGEHGRLEAERRTEAKRRAVDREPSSTPSGTGS
jgi:thymidylate synthase ThyX